MLIFCFVLGRTCLILSLCLLNKSTCSLEERSKKNFSSKTYFAGVFKIDVSLFINTHTVCYRLSLASWHSSNSNHSWIYRFVPEDWQVYHSWPVPAVGTPRWGPDSPLSCGNRFSTRPQCCQVLPAMPGIFKKLASDVDVILGMNTALMHTDIVSCHQSRAVCSAFQLSSRAHKAASAVPAPKGGLTSRMWSPELGFVEESSDDNHTSLLAEEKWPLGSTQ